MTFAQTVAKYRQRYGRHPPPGFKEWYKFARDKNVHNIDDFDQIMDDLRPFWGVDPTIIRSLAANMPGEPGSGLSGIYIRDHKVFKDEAKDDSWRSTVLVTLIEKIVEHLPDMDIAMNRLDQPRLVVPWEDMQELLDKEVASRQIPPESLDEWSKGMQGLYIEGAENITMPESGWFSAAGKQYMDLAKEACPPESHARDENSTLASAEALYKDPLGGIITNFNRSTDLCTVGPEIEWRHGFLFSSSSILASRRLLPVFGECKVSVNSDILFPANMYWKDDERYDYNGQFDVDWEDKSDVMVWRGVTSGGAQLATNWKEMHRQRLVQLMNSTIMADQEVRILSENPMNRGIYENHYRFLPSSFAAAHSDVGFVEAWGCIPNCEFYNDVWTLKPQISLSEQFKYKYLVDVDGHSFSGRWRAFLQSKSLGIKATIFREWHDSRLFAWRHFVPMDNRFDDVYTLLTYFIGFGKPGFVGPGKDGELGDDGIDGYKNNYANADVYVQRHDFEGKRIARQAREWASKVLRQEDIEVSYLVTLAHSLFCCSFCYTFFYPY